MAIHSVQASCIDCSNLEFNSLVDLLENKQSEYIVWKKVGKMYNVLSSNDF